MSRKKRTRHSSPVRVEDALERNTVSILSPLRYPGGKRRLAGYIAAAIRLNKLRPKLFVEPFAGGASVALQLLNDGLVDSIALGEKDPLVASFWKTAFYDHEWLIRRLSEVKPSVENWDRFKKGNFQSRRWQALACVFLNRTSFSGILAQGAGPIGGRSQNSPHKIDCRFNAGGLAKRIHKAAELRERVTFVNEGGWESTVEKVKALGHKEGEVLYYFDPPFYNKAEMLYRYFFEDCDHVALHDALPGLEDQRWILSYDPAEPVIEMYTHNGIGPKRVELLYSATRPGELLKSQELVITNLREMPTETRLWRTAEEWK